MNSLETTTRLHSSYLQKPVTISLTNRLSVRLYLDSRPRCMETAPLHKGLVLLLDNKEVIEEGMGFGVPVIKYNDKTYFSSSADVSIQKNHSVFSIKKTFVLDAISRKKFWRSTYLDDGVYSMARKNFEKLYLRHKNFSSVFNNIMELRNLAKIKTDFQKVNPRGTINVNYEIQTSTINIKADFSDLSLDGCEEILVLNEQGSTIFDTYVDSYNLKLVGNKIGGWDEVIANQARMLSSKRQVSFCIQKNRGAALFRGWENTKRRFSWAGLNYSLGPNCKIFNYSVYLRS